MKIYPKKKLTPIEKRSQFCCLIHLTTIKVFFALSVRMGSVTAPLVQFISFF